MKLDNLILTNFNTYWISWEQNILYVTEFNKNRMKQIFPSSSFNDPNLKIHILQGKIKVVKRWTINFCLFWNLIHWNPLTNARDMAMLLLLDLVVKMAPKPIDLINTHYNSQYWMCACYDRHIKLCSSVMWLITVINKSWRMVSAIGTSWQM